MLPPEPQHPRPGLPGQGYQPRTSSSSNGQKPSPPQGGSGLPSHPPVTHPPAFPELNKVLSLVGDLAEAEDMITDLIEHAAVGEGTKGKLEYSRERVRRVKNELFRRLSEPHKVAL